jgi:ketosteroid isomerase-like protein
VASANVELVESICADWARGEYRSIDWAHPDIEFEIADLPDSATHRGVASMARAWQEFLTAWSGHAAVPDDVRELDEERILVLGHLTAHGKASGLEVGQVRALGANLFHIRDGKVTRLVVYFNRDHAFADLGLAREA